MIVDVKQEKVNFVLPSNEDGEQNTETQSGETQSGTWHLFGRDIPKGTVIAVAAALLISIVFVVVMIKTSK